ncbi:nicotinate-nucleotide diphosphorylase (carboxylating) [Glaciecola punicea]|nr:carboxylating nicotinate-nucleotide diphosphorylase [Glaciecola punicea]OFA32442.1 nicotinate-nucleotide diphosphorylase (carboxylating) [Glaciecola punicea]
MVSQRKTASNEKIVHAQSNQSSTINQATEKKPNQAGATQQNDMSNVLIALDVMRALIEDLSAESSHYLSLNFDTTSASYQQTLDAIHNLAKQDITANLIDVSAQAQAHIITREDITVCGRQWAQMAFELIDPSLKLTWHCSDGEQIKANAILVNITGNARAILTAERTALNFLQMLSATATTTAWYAKCLTGTSTALLDTRKTIPGFRQAQKYAVRCGGGKNHRMGLYDAFLIKENHIKACGSITNAILQAKDLQSAKIVEIEVESLDELREAIAAGADIVMLDNFSTQQIQEAVSINSQRCKLEVSGNITQERLAELAKTGVDFISSGAITKHVNAVDLSLLIL